MACVPSDWSVRVFATGLEHSALRLHVQSEQAITIRNEVVNQNNFLDVKLLLNDAAVDDPAITIGEAHFVVFHRASHREACN